MAEINPAQINQLKQFVTLCKSNGAIIHLPELSFLKDWLLRYLQSSKLSSFFFFFFYY